MTSKTFEKNKAYFILILLIIIASGFAIGENEKIAINLQYKTGTNWDINNDGIEPLTGVIDFTVEYSYFNWDYDDKNLCTRWRILNLDTKESTTICNGDEGCCGFIGLQPTREQWNTEFYLYYGLYGAGPNNKVSAQIINIDYSLDLDNSYSNIYYSEWAELPAYFIGSETRTTSSITTQNNLTITITSPYNSSALGSGENIYLNLSVDSIVAANYSLDNREGIYLGIASDFTTLLNGTLAQGVLANGPHNLKIYIEDYLGNNATINHTFTVNDTSKPIISLNITNNSTIYGKDYLQEFNLTSDEYANIQYRLNNNNPVNLGIIKNSTLSLTLQDGTNNLIINATDQHNNNILNFYTFDLITPSCSDGIQNGDETGIDCGGSCSFNCYPLSLATDKPAYNQGESVWITVMLRDNSAVNITTSIENNIIYSDYYSTSFPLSYSRSFGASNPGNYTVKAVRYYLNTTENKTVCFYVNSTTQTNPLSVTINANATTINEGETIAFSASISGNSGDITYKWDFTNDGAIDSNSASPTYTYSTNGTYTINLTVYDSKWNKSDIETITVRKPYDITFTVKENSTGSPIENALVEIDDKQKNTSSDGKAVFNIPFGSYGLTIKKSGYKTYSENIDIYNQSIDIRLIETDDDSPSIEIVGPTENQTISSNSIVLKYKASDKSEISCKLYIKIGSEWKLKNTTAGITDNSEKSFQLDNLDNKTYEWKIVCNDIYGNSKTSGIYSFTVDASEQPAELLAASEEQYNNTDGIISEIDSIVSSLTSLNSNEKEAAEALKLSKTLEDAKINLKRADRDLHNLIWRRLNESELEEAKNELLQRVEDIRNSIPKSLEVLESNEFVSYPNKKDIENISLTYLNLNNINLNKKQKQQFIESNKEIQSLITATTKSKIVAVEYLSGEQKTITLIQKIIKIKGNLSDLLFYEVIPKDIADDINDTELLFEHTIIERDPIIEIDIAKINNFAYYMSKRIELKETEKINSILINKNTELESKSKITGFSIFQNIKPAFMHSSNTRLVIEIVIIVLLIIIYASYSLGGFDRLGHILNSKEIKEINKLLTSAKEDISNNDYEKASSKYKEINSKFNKLDKKKRDKVKNSIVELLNKVNMLYINKLTDAANNCIRSNDKAASYSIYLKIQSLYKTIPKEYKTEVLKKCMELHDKLNSVTPA